MTSKFSRAALIAGIAIGASGLVAVPAEAANGVSTANYYVNNPLAGSATNVTPESATVSAVIDTGGSPESVLPTPAAGVTWSTLAGITVLPETWNDGSSTAASTTGNYAPIDGLPVSGSNSDVAVKITDSTGSNLITGASGVSQPLSNGGADNYSDVTFEYDPVSDYDAADNLPGAQLGAAPDVQVPTVAGLSTVSTTIGAFGQAAQNSTGNTPLMPGTKYYFWIIQQAGGTDQATNVNISAWANNQSNGVPANNAYKCYPNAAIADDTALEALVQPNATVTWGGATLPGSQGPCFYYYGNTSGATYYQSPNGTFTTPPLGKVKINAKAAVSGSKATLALTNMSAYKASGTVELTAGRKLAGSVKFHLAPTGKGDFKIALNAKGKSALAKGGTLKVAPVSQTANIASVSNWDQPLSGRSVKL